MEPNVINMSPQIDEMGDTLKKNKSFPFPPCWTNDEHMKQLFAPFQQRELNPLRYDEKIHFWLELIGLYCEQKGEAHFTCLELQNFFTRKNCTPNCLGTILEYMRKCKKIRFQPEYEFDPLNTWTGCVINWILKKPVVWGLKTVMTALNMLDGSEPEMLPFVYLEVAKKFCDHLEYQVLHYITPGTLINFKTLKEQIAQTTLVITDECLVMCLYTMYCQRCIGLEYTENQGDRTIHLIKVPVKKGKDVKITEADHAMYNIQMVKTNLQKQVDELENDIKEVDHKIREFLRYEKRLVAKAYLARKHRLQHEQRVRLCAIKNAESIIENVNCANTEDEILEAYRVGSKTLQQLLNESGLKYDKVHNAILNVKETVEEHRDVEELVENVNISPEFYQNFEDNELLEMELNEIICKEIKPMATMSEISKLNASLNESDKEIVTLMEQLSLEDNAFSERKITMQKSTIRIPN